MKIRFHFNLRQIVKWSLAVLALGWMTGALWFLFIQPSGYNTYNSQQSKLARCRAYTTSEARYQCTSELMLAKDNAIFYQSLVVVLPAFGLMVGYLGVTRALMAHRERVRSRSAVDASRKRLAEWRRQLKEAKAAAAKQANGALAPVPVPVRPSGAIPPPPAKKR